MTLLLSSAFAADLCANMGATVRAAPGGFAQARALPGASCDLVRGDYVCVFPGRVESDAFPALWESVVDGLAACRIGARHSEVSDDPELLYLPSSWTTPEAQVELRVAEPGIGVEVRFLRAPRS